MAQKSGVSGALRRKVFNRDGYRCVFCGLQGWQVSHGNGGFGHPTELEGVYLSIDHIVHRSAGGSSTDPSNLRTLCTDCNTKRGRKNDAVFFARIATDHSLTKV